MTANEERELLQLQCELVRLKIIQSRRKLQRVNPANQPLSNWLNALTSLSPNVWQMALLPKQKKYQVLFLGAMVLAQMILGRKTRE